jgi:carbon monoxide dehydrogenase subunit G
LIDINGDIELGKPKESVTKFLQNPSNFSKCLPQLESMKIIDENHFEAKFRLIVPERMNISYLSSISIKMLFDMKASGDLTTISGEGRVLGSKVHLKLDLTSIAKDADDCHLHWNASLEAGTLAKVLGEDSVREASAQTASEIVECIKNEL